MRHTRAHTANRRSHDGLHAPARTVCPKCKAPVLSHRVCMTCGTYRGREVVDVLKKLRKEEQKRTAEKEEKKP